MEWHTVSILIISAWSLGYHIGSYMAYRRGRKDGFDHGELMECLKWMGIDIDA